MNETRKRLAIIGCGSSGLVTLKYALDLLTDWDVVVFEKSNGVRGCWGNPHSEFVSTSTKYTTQFACFPIYEATVDPAAQYSEFFRGGEYGDYLDRFADRFDLRKHVRFGCSFKHAKRIGDRWQLSIEAENITNHELFDSLIVCTGLAAKPKAIESNVPVMRVGQGDRVDGIRDRNVVVIGGGESAVDLATRLADDALGNRVYLSLKSGVRVSPRYHPIRGVPSDFLRNRLMLAIDYRMRNWIGEHFVKARIRFRRAFEWMFPKRGVPNDPDDRESNVDRRQKYWDMKLTESAKDCLFNMFHNKSDGFLEAVGQERIRIIGPPLDASFQCSHDFDRQATLQVAADLVVPSIGFSADFGHFEDSANVRLSDFYLGCIHRAHRNLFAIGFARPIIGNIPTISEMQARLVIAMIAAPNKHCSLDDLAALHSQERENLKARFREIDISKVYPVELIPYCDQLASLMGCQPKVTSIRRWRQIMLGPATTLHYEHDSMEAAWRYQAAERFMPLPLIAILLLLRPVSWLLEKINSRFRFRKRNVYGTEC